MYEVYPVLIFIVIILGVLFGILCGFLMAYRIADRNSKNGGNGFGTSLDKKTESKEKPTVNPAEDAKSLKGLFKKQDKAAPLRSKIHDQSSMSYNEFKSFNADENHDEALLEAMIKQDEAYSYVAANYQMQNTPE